jgi:pilus assembly protein Flp/PilA
MEYQSNDNHTVGGLVVNKIYQQVWRLRLWKETHGQDLIEYSLLAGFVAVAAGATFPPVANNIATIFSKITSSLNVAGSQS